MKLFKKVLAVVLVGAMAVSMLTACGESSKTADIKNALKDVGITATKPMNKETNKAMDALQSATASIANGTATAEQASAEVKKMTEYSFAHTANGQGGAGIGNGGVYDLYIWTNGADGKPGGGNYPYLYRVDPIHVTKENLSRLMAKDFVQKGVFDGSDATLATLKSVLGDATLNSQKVTNVGISCQKVYGMDVLLVTVPHGASVPQTTKSST